MEAGGGFTPRTHFSNWPWLAQAQVRDWMRRPTAQLPERWWVSAALIGAAVIAFVAALEANAIEFPVNVGRDVELWIKDAIEWFQRTFQGIIEVIKDVGVWFLVAFGDMLFWAPWPAIVIATGLLCWRVVNFRLALFAVGSLILLAAFGYWIETMETLAFIIVSVSLSLIIAIPLGILASQSDTVDALFRPFLDMMQTLPSFVYLVPAVALLSLGDLPGIFATLIYATPPAIRLTNLGIRQLPTETLEAAESFGMTRRQMLLNVKIPLAIPTIMAGVNQTTLMALAMLAIAALVGAGGLGGVVYQGLGRLEHGQAVVGGLGIVVLAIITDRVTQSFAERQRAAYEGSGAADEVARPPANPVAP